MSFSYSGNPSDSDLDEVRFYVADTDSNDPILSDEEVLFLITTYKPIHGDNLFVASVVADFIAGKYAREVSVSADGVSIQMSELQSKYEQLSNHLREQFKLKTSFEGNPDVGGIMYGETLDYGIKPLVWAVGMQDNYRAGQQDFGGKRLAAGGWWNPLLDTPNEGGLVTETP